MFIVLFYIEEEVETENVIFPSKKKPSDFLGILTPEEGDRFEEHVKKIRNQWG